jgi:hypothetical protein
MTHLIIITLIIFPLRLLIMMFQCTVETVMIRYTRMRIMRVIPEKSSSHTIGVDIQFVQLLVILVYPLQSFRQRGRNSIKYSVLH